MLQKDCFFIRDILLICLLPIVNKGCKAIWLFFMKLAVFKKKTQKTTNFIKNVENNVVVLI